jgi:hypothetical protein
MTSLFRALPWLVLLLITAALTWIAYDATARPVAYLRTPTGEIVACYERGERVNLTRCAHGYEAVWVAPNWGE